MRVSPATPSSAHLYPPCACCECLAAGWPAARRLRRRQSRRRSRRLARASLAEVSARLPGTDAPLAGALPVAGGAAAAGRQRDISTLGPGYLPSARRNTCSRSTPPTAWGQPRHLACRGHRLRYLRRLRFDADARPTSVKVRTSSAVALQYYVIVSDYVNGWWTPLGPFDGQAAGFTEVELPYDSEHLAGDSFTTKPGPGCQDGRFYLACWSAAVRAGVLRIEELQLGTHGGAGAHGRGWMSMKNRCTPATWSAVPFTRRAAAGLCRLCRRARPGVLWLVQRVASTGNKRFFMDSEARHLPLPRLLQGQRRNRSPYFPKELESSGVLLLANDYVAQMKLPPRPALRARRMSRSSWPTASAIPQTRSAITSSALATTALVINQPGPSSPCTWSPAATTFRARSMTAESPATPSRSSL